MGWSTAVTHPDDAVMSVHGGWASCPWTISPDHRDGPELQTGGVVWFHVKPSTARFVRTFRREVGPRCFT